MKKSLESKNNYNSADGPEGHYSPSGERKSPVELLEFYEVMVSNVPSMRGIRPSFIVVDEIDYFYVNDKNEWVKIGELNINNWGKSIYIGLATLSHDNSQLTTVTYKNIHLSNQHGN